MKAASSRLYIFNLQIDGKPVDSLSCGSEEVLYFTAETAPQSLTGVLSHEGAKKRLESFSLASGLDELKQQESLSTAPEMASAVIYCPKKLPLTPSEEKEIQFLLTARTNLLIVVYAPLVDASLIPATSPVLRFRTSSRLSEKPLFSLLYPASAWLLSGLDTMAFLMFLSFRIGLALLLVAWLCTLLLRVLASRYFLRCEKVDAVLFPWLAVLIVSPLVYEIVFFALELYSLQNGAPFPTITIPLYVYFLLFFFHSFLALSLALATNRRQRVFFVAKEDKAASLVALHLPPESPVYTRFDFQNLLSIFHAQYWLLSVLRFKKKDVSNGRWYFVSYADYEQARLAGRVGSFVYFRKGAFKA
jgi:hypothetical protein